jgi:CRISPR/Cas system Type II protein with McrA/HNH and RuvC-like nuclease domain
MSLSFTLNLPTVAAEIVTAQAFASRAESAKAGGNVAEAEALHQDAERRYTSRLRRICELREVEAEIIEPTLTKLEQQLFRLHALL